MAKTFDPYLRPLPSRQPTPSGHHPLQALLIGFVAGPVLLCALLYIFSRSG